MITTWDGGGLKLGSWDAGQLGSWAAGQVHVEFEEFDLWLLFVFWILLVSSCPRPGSRIRNPDPEGDSFRYP